MAAIPIIRWRRIDIVIEGNAKVTTEAGGDVSIGGKNGEISNDDLLSKDFTGILTRKDNTGKVMEDYSKDATPLPASEEERRGLGRR